MKYILTIALMMTFQAIHAQVPQALYPGEIPNYIAGSNIENSAISGGILRISNVTDPVYTLYLAPENAQLKKPMVIIFPGGGYRILAASHEGSDIARKFNEFGVNVMVVHYRLPDSTRQIEKQFAPLQDAQQAIRVARQQAKNWNLDSTKIGVMGFSAGGHLAASAATHFAFDYTKVNDGQNLRPDFQLLIYPVIT
ncbi:MAG: alpha/beta hydrolase, partial [Bacteroidota bacterium]